MNKRQWFRPSADIVQDEDKHQVLIDLPGVGEEELDVRIDQNQLVVEAIRSKEMGYRRSFGLPNRADVHSIVAELDEGVLTISISKLKAVRKITVHRGSRASS